MKNQVFEKQLLKNNIKCLQITFLSNFSSQLAPWGVSANSLFRAFLSFGPSWGPNASKSSPWKPKCLKIKPWRPERPRSRFTRLQKARDFWKALRSCFTRPLQGDKVSGRLPEAVLQGGRDVQKAREFQKAPRKCFTAILKG